MAFDIFDTLTLVDVIRVQQPIDNYWVPVADQGGEMKTAINAGVNPGQLGVGDPGHNLFPREIAFQTETIFFDVVTEHKKLAPFVAPNVQGRVQMDQGYHTKSFKPAYIKIKHAIDPSRAVPRLAGEQPLGTLSLEERYNAIIGENMRLESNAVQRRWDWMGCRAIVDGQVTVEGEDYPSVTVSFGQDPSLQVTNIGAALWTATATADPLADIEAMRRQIFFLSRCPTTRLTFGLDAWAAFVEIPKVYNTLAALWRGSQSDFTRTPTTGTTYEYMGILQGSNGAGRLEMYRYHDYYEDAAGNTQFFIDPGTVIFTGPGIQGVRCFGAIKDRRAQLQSLSMFPKMWDIEDPSGTYTMTQSAPLMVPAQPNAMGTMKVV